MPESNSWSVSVQVVNETADALTVVDLYAGNGAIWREDARPERGDVVPPGGTARWGVLTRTGGEAISGLVVLGGGGGQVVPVMFLLSGQGQGGCTIQPNRLANGQALQADSGQGNQHLLYEARLLPAG